MAGTGAAALPDVASAVFGAVVVVALLLRAVGAGVAGALFDMTRADGRCAVCAVLDMTSAVDGAGVAAVLWLTRAVVGAGVDDGVSVSAVVRATGGVAEGAVTMAGRAAAVLPCAALESAGADATSTDR